MSLSIDTVFDTQRAERTEGVGGVISGYLTITDGTAGGDVWLSIAQKFKMVWGVVFNHALTTDGSPVSAFLNYDKATGKVAIKTAGIRSISPVFFIARGQV